MAEKTLWREVVCIASGPSLTADDCARVRAWKDGGTDRGVIVVNSSFLMAPWADALWAMDQAWWNKMGAQAAKAFRGEFWAPDRADLSAFKKARFQPSIRQPNSGLGAIAAAAETGARRIILLGYDGTLGADGRTHWHGSHPQELGNARTVAKWPGQADVLAKSLTTKYPGIEIVNCTPGSAIDAFKRIPLIKALGSLPALHIIGMHGMGDNLHQRSIVRKLASQNEIWIDTPWPCLYHDMPAVHVISKGTKLRTQAKNLAREAAAFEKVEPPNGAEELNVKYSPRAVRELGSVQKAMAAQCGVRVSGLDPLPVPSAWNARAQALLEQWKPEKPLLMLRPLVERKEWGGAKPRNPDPDAYAALYAGIRDRFFVVSVADLEPDQEWLVGPDLPADVVMHAGELDVEVLAALFARAALVFTAPGFALILAQAVGTPVAAVFGGYESARSFSTGAELTPTLSIEPMNPCECFSHSHACDKRIDTEAARARLAAFVAAQVGAGAPC